MRRILLVSISVLSATVIANAQAPTGTPGTPSITAAPQPSSRSGVISTSPQSPGASSNPFSGSIPSGEVTPGILQLTLEDAIQRGLRQNLGIVLGGQNTRIARGQQMQARSALLPNLTARVSDVEQQVNLAAFGFSFNFPSIPGAPPFSIPSVVGPFNVFDARAYFSAPLLDLRALNNSRASAQLTRAADLTNRDARDTVVQVVAAGYLQVIADQARVDETRSEVTTARTLYERAQDQLRNGLAPALDALRAQVELQSQQTRLREYENDFAKDKLALARLIGLPLQQEFALSDQVPYIDLTPPDLQAAMSQAVQTRADYQSADARVRAAELARRASVAERYPKLSVNADYGDIGKSPWSSHGTFTASVGMSVNVFYGGRIRGEIEESDAELVQRRAERDDLRGRIEFEVRTALLDLQTAADQVRVAQSSVDLSHQALTQAQDRFTAGVADNIEVVQAQNALASSTATYINSLYAHNLAKVALARALGVAGQGLKPYLGGK